MNILLTGGSGFVGRYIYKNLIKDGHSVFTFSRKKNTYGTVYWILTLIISAWVPMFLILKKGRKRGHQKVQEPSHGSIQSLKLKKGVFFNQKK